MGLRLEDGLGDGHAEQVVLRRLEVPEPFGKHGERTLDGRLDDDVAEYHRYGRLTHESSSATCSTASAQPANARFQYASS